MGMEGKETGCMARDSRVQKFVLEATANSKYGVAILCSLRYKFRRDIRYMIGLRNPA